MILLPDGKILNIDPDLERQTKHKLYPLGSTCGIYTYVYRKEDGTYQFKEDAKNKGD